MKPVYRLKISFAEYMARERKRKQKRLRKNIKK